MLTEWLHLYTIIRGFLRKNDTSRAMELFHVMAKRGFSADSYTKSMVVDFLPAGGLHPSSREKIQNYVWRFYQVFNVNIVKWRFHSEKSDKGSNLYGVRLIYD